MNTNRARNRETKIITMTTIAPVDICPCSAEVAEVALLVSFPVGVGLVAPALRVLDPPEIWETVSRVLIGTFPAFATPVFATPPCEDGKGSLALLPELSAPNEPSEVVGVTPPSVTADGIARLLVVEEPPELPGGEVSVEPVLKF
jgi:hypothetical protein